MARRVEFAESRSVEVNSKKLPSPEDWLRSLGFLGKPWQELIKAWVTTPVLKVIKRSGSLTPVLVKTVEFVNTAGSSGNFLNINPEIADVSYSYSYAGKSSQS